MSYKGVQMLKEATRMKKKRPEWKRSVQNEGSCSGMVRRSFKASRRNKVCRASSVRKCAAKASRCWQRKKMSCRGVQMLKEASRMKSKRAEWTKLQRLFKKWLNWKKVPVQARPKKNVDTGCWSILYYNILYYIILYYILYYITLYNLFILCYYIYIIYYNILILN